MKDFKKIIKDMISPNRDMPARPPSGDYMGGAVYQREQVRKRGKAVCKNCGKVMHNTPKGWADECYDCASQRE